MELVVAIPTIVGTFAFVLANRQAFDRAWLIWIVLIAAIELLPVPKWRGLTITLGFPIMMMVAILYEPWAAGFIALAGSSDPREFRRQVGIGLALFNRSQVALSVVAASLAFHAIAPPEAPPWQLLAAASLAAVADYAMNAGLVTLYMAAKLRVAPQAVLKQLTIGGLKEFLVSYLGLGVLGLTLAVLFDAVRWWSLPAYLAPILFARQMFFRSIALEEAHGELKEREAVLRELSNTMAEERADERLQIAGYLHDDLAQVLFRLSLQVDIARKLLDKGDLSELSAQLDKIRASKQETSERVRALIRDLHRSPLGAKGLSEALESFTDEVGRDSGVLFHRDIDDIDLPAPIALLVYHIAREGVMNALKHARATDMWIGVHEEADDIVLQLKDNGVGFDTSQPGPEGHFGMAMMRERAQVGGGRCEVESTPGQGTTITVRFPTDLLQRGPQSGSEQASASGSERASPGTPGTTSRAVGDSRGSVPA